MQKQVNIGNLDTNDDIAKLKHHLNELYSMSKIVRTGTGAPNFTPSDVGSIYIDTLNSNIYMSKGTGTSSDWLKIN